MENIPSGTIIDESMLDIRRPGTGLSPLFYDKLIGKTTKINIIKNQSITWNMMNNA